MKKLNSLLMVALFSGAVMFSVTSCKDECKDITCENGGTCDEGVCDCPEGFSGDLCEDEDLCITNEVECLNDGTCMDGECDCTDGYEGDDCGTESRTKMVASYTASDACSMSGSASYTTSISSSSTSVPGILISNFWDVFENSVTATVDGNTITIPSQDPDNDGYSVSGSGTYSNNSITWSYSITDPVGVVDNCSSTWAKQ